MQKAVITAEVPPGTLDLLRVLLLAGLVVLLAACDSDPNGPDPFEAREVGVVVNSVEHSLTIFSVDDPSATMTVGLGAAGSPVTLSLREGVAVVPMGTFPSVAVVDLAEGTVLRSIGLPEGSGATGSAFLNDSIVLVSNPGLNTVSPVNIRAGTRGAQIQTGGYPQRIVVHGEKAFILNAELGDDFQPARAGTVTVLDAETLEHLGTIELSGENPAGATVVAGTLYIVNGGRYFENTGSLSAVDPDLESEVAHFEGFGDFPGTITGGPDGRLYVTSFSYGLSVWHPATESFVLPPEEAVSAGGVPSASGAAFDSGGGLYVLIPECQTSATAVRLTADFEDEIEIPVGICPADIGFTEVEVAVDPR